MSGIPRPLVRVNQWFIFICATAFIVTLHPMFLIIPLSVGVSSLFFNSNPVMKVGKLFLRKPMTSYLLEDKEQQAFNQKIAVSLLTLALVASFVSIEWLAITSAIMVALATFIAILGFCIGCFVRFQWKRYQYKRTLHTQCKGS
ncbi:DUF4395 domain-containing protein [Guptibacillus algicola]|uniref:DUF4395 domain-containing protein n=1 Tax=Guptibacillus algicola TaxID=225844 RepID=UPI001CD2BD44|nr:DUF4395 domain-containing protein [Alkalihalobacillus algicola]MCA0988317.1 DUF4395 domain-containing protein [Alkalihalobacillus algicola]